MYPSSKELIPEVFQAMLPASLEREIVERYETLGSAYISEDKTGDGRSINKMMFTSRIDNCLEEVVDAAFCMLGWAFKARHAGQNIPDSCYTVLQQLCDIYTLLVTEREAGTPS